MPDLQRTLTTGRHIPAPPDLHKTQRKRANSASTHHSTGLAIPHNPPPNLCRDRTQSSHNQQLCDHTNGSGATHHREDPRELSKTIPRQYTVYVQRNQSQHNTATVLHDVVTYHGHPTRRRPPGPPLSTDPTPPSPPEPCNNPASLTITK